MYVCVYKRYTPMAKIYYVCVVYYVCTMYSFVRFYIEYYIIGCRHILHCFFAVLVGNIKKKKIKPVLLCIRK